jgi:hypothetical protein
MSAADTGTRFTGWGLKSHRDHRGSHRLTRPSNATGDELAAIIPPAAQTKEAAGIAWRAVEHLAHGLLPGAGVFWGVARICAVEGVPWTAI